MKQYTLARIMTELKSGAFLNWLPATFGAAEYRVEWGQSITDYLSFVLDNNLDATLQTTDGSQDLSPDLDATPGNGVTTIEISINASGFSQYRVWRFDAETNTDILQSEGTELPIHALCFDPGTYVVEIRRTGSGFLKVSADADLTAHINKFDSLPLSTNDNSIPANNAIGCTITCNAPIIAGDGSVNYRFWFLGQVVGSGSQALAAGVMSLPFGADTPGQYLIEIQRNGGQFETGYIEIEATEV